MDYQQIGNFYYAAFAFTSAAMNAVSRRSSTTAQVMTRAKFAIGADVDWLDISDEFDGAECRSNYEFMNRADIIEASGFDAGDFE